ncbi:arginase family protein [Catellatospora sichuanensis]|uniref:arginase family protein n=1 Tax=Catellatospora sichuanensis TaxID=1969805 RepID=UPI001C91D13D|nr:arginase family protein [Catellatospora sichuanensis]
MTIIFVPYHLDERLPDHDFPLPDGHTVRTVTEQLPDGDVWARLGHLYEPVAWQVAHCVQSGETPTVVSGDCTVSLGTMAGLQQAGVDAGIVWFDAHGDVQTLETTASGYAGGMPLRILVGYRPELISQRLGLRPLAEDRALLVDARDLDQPEADYLATAAVRRCGVDDLDAAMLPPGPLVLHVDLDVIDAGELPDLRFPVSGGPTASAVVAAARRVLDTGRVAAVDIACTWHPGRLDPHGVRAGLLSALTAS